MIAGGTLYLSKQTPVASTAADGQFGLTLLAYDRQGYKQVEPWRLIWMGADAHAFYQVHARDLVAGAPLEVSVAKVRLISGAGRSAGPEIHAQVKSLYLPKAY